jgi:hypothetical protein
MSTTWKTKVREVCKTDFGKYIPTGETLSAEGFVERYPDCKCHLVTICDPERRVYYAPASDGLTYFAIAVPIDEIFLDSRSPARHLPADTTNLERV